jgi:hypothetical protein
MIAWSSVEFHSFKGTVVWPEVEEELEVGLWRFIHSETFNSVTRRQLVKTENPSACVTVNCKLCKSAIALYWL